MSHKRTVLVLVPVIFLLHAAWQAIVQVDNSWEHAMSRSLIALLLMFVIHGLLLWAILLIKSPSLLRSILALYFGWALTYASINLMMVLDTWDTRLTSKAAWAAVLILVVTVVSALLSLLTLEPLMALGTAWGVGAYAAYLGYDDTYSDPILFTVFWLSIASVIMLVIAAVISAILWRSFRARRYGG